ncbi:hypothetical protein [Bradyrhizobium sp.]|uniref:hypothetical protein n=1 Tax=Bradyrhizobium sp. TaxID=376 RepID=UPI003C5CAC26
MMIVLLIAGVVAMLTGAAAILYGIPIKEFGFGNTMILVGSVAICTGMILVGLAMVVGELKSLGRRLMARAPTESRARTGQEALAVPGHDNLLFQRDQPALPDFNSLEATPAPPVSPPRNGTGARGLQEGRPDGRKGARKAARQDMLPEPEPEPEPESEPAPKPRRNLMFASSSRKERERAQARAADPLDLDSLDLDARALDFRPSRPPEPLPDLDENPPAAFDDAWPKPERARAAEGGAARRGGRMPSNFVEAEARASAATEHAPPPSDEPEVSVLKSGVVDGMAYSLYSDGSIEAQMPEGMMRFESIDDLRAHLDQRS